MAAAQPETKTADLIEELNKLIDAPQLNEFRIAQIKKDAEALYNVDPIERLVVLGIIATLKYDIPEVYKCFDQAMNMEFGSEFVVANYTNSLSYLSCRAKLVELYESIVSVNNNPILIKELTALYLYNGQFDFFYQHLLEISEEEKAETFVDKFKDFPAFLDLMKEKEITFEDVEILVETAYQVLQKNKVFSFSKSFNIENSDDELWFDFEIGVRSSREVCDRLTDELIAEWEKKGLCPRVTEYVDINYISKEEFDDWAKEPDWEKIESDLDNPELITPVTKADFERFQEILK